MNNNDLLEQCRKEAEELYPLCSDSIGMVIANKRNAYIEGCKATHANLQSQLSEKDKEIERLNKQHDVTYQAAYKQGFDDGKRNIKANH